MSRSSLPAAALLTLFVVALALSFIAANYVEQNTTAQALVEQFGYGGILFLAIISGLNLFIPIPAATFTPIYEAAGFPLQIVIVLLVVGTFIADSLAYLIGVGGRSWITERYAAFQARLQTFAATHSPLVPLLLFCYVAFMPLPNEIILIPLALVGVPFRVLIMPLLVGGLVHQTILTYGATSLFNVFFN